MQLILMRHGQTDDNIDHRYTGVLDIPLNEIGREQAHAAGSVPAVPLVFTSHLSRARETARICFPNARQIVNPALAEMDFGEFQGRTPNEMEHDAAYRSWVDSWCLLPCPHGESRDEFTARVANAVRDIVIEQEVAGAKRAIIVAHGGTVMATLFTFACADEAREYYQWNPGNCCGWQADVVHAHDGSQDESATCAPFTLCNIMHFDRLDQLAETP